MLGYCLAGTEATVILHSTPDTSYVEEMIEKALSVLCFSLDELTLSKSIFNYS